MLLYRLLPQIQRRGAKGVMEIMTERLHSSQRWHQGEWCHIQEQLTPVYLASSLIGFRPGKQQLKARANFGIRSGQGGVQRGLKLGPRYDAFAT